MTPARKHRRKADRPSYLSQETLDRCAAEGMKRLQERVEKMRAEEQSK